MGAWVVVFRKAVPDGGKTREEGEVVSGFLHVDLERLGYLQYYDEGKEYPPKRRLCHVSESLIVGARASSVFSEFPAVQH